MIVAQSHHRRILILAVAGLLVVWSAPAFAFSPDDILSDEDMADQSMDDREIQEFLSSQRSALSAAGPRQIIGQAAAEYRISPKVLLSLLQKEQSLVTDPSPSLRQMDWATGYGVCDDCRLDDPGIARYRGFTTQVRSAAALLRDILDNPQQYSVRKGEFTTIDGRLIAPKTQATAALYVYTPHLRGNEVFWAIFSRWFRRQYPDGTLMRAEDDPTVWFIQYGQRRPIASMAVLRSRFGARRTLMAPAAEIAKFPVGPVVSLPNYSLVRAPDGLLALIDGDTYRPFASPEAFRAIGYHPEEIEDVAAETISSYSKGAAITTASVYPQGALLQDSKTGGVYYVENGIKHALVDRVLLQQFPRRSITRSSREMLQQFPLGDPVGLEEGALVKSPDDRTVFVISQGRRRAIATEKAFIAFGYRWADVQTVPAKLLSLHPLGVVLDSATDDIPVSDPRPATRDTRDKEVKR